MPRQARLFSAAGIYHVFFRGINKSKIFHDNQDCYYLLQVLEKVKKKTEYQLHAYCLMVNHAHLLIKAEGKQLSDVMKLILQMYASYFNRRYKRVGHVFQDRYRSEVIDSERYFMACARYIHNNPVTSKMARLPQDYRWSSYPHYLNPRPHPLLNTELLMSCFGSNQRQAISALQEYTSQESQEAFIDCEDDLQAVVEQILTQHGITPSSFKKIPPATRQRLIAELWKATNLSARAISEIIGINKNIVCTAISQAKRTKTS